MAHCSARFPANVQSAAAGRACLERDPHGQNVAWTRGGWTFGPPLAAATFRRAIVWRQRLRDSMVWFWIALSDGTGLISCQVAAFVRLRGYDESFNRDTCSPVRRREMHRRPRRRALPVWLRYAPLASATDTCGIHAARQAQAEPVESVCRNTARTAPSRTVFVDMLRPLRAFLSRAAYDRMESRLGARRDRCR